MALVNAIKGVAFSLLVLLGAMLYAVAETTISPQCPSGGCALSEEPSEEGSLIQSRGRHRSEGTQAAAAPLAPEHWMGRARNAGACEENTGRWCNTGECWLWQGPVECLHQGGFMGHRCHCRDGFCAQDDDTCASELDTVVADVEAVDDDHPTFPGSHANISISIAFSGGGIRALTWAHGGLRALEQLNLMSSVDAVSAVSGGAWGSAIYMFANDSIEALLGAQTDPSALTLAELSKDPPLGIRTTLTDPLPYLSGLLAQGAPTEMMGQFYSSWTFLHPFGLDDMWSYMATDAEHVARIKKRNPGLASAKFLTPQPGRPKAYIINGVVLAPIGYVGGTTNAIPLQMSPDFTGSPFRPDGGTVNYEAISGSDPALSQVTVGGGFVETFAFGGEAPADQSGGNDVTVGAPVRPFSLAQAIGISSMASGTQIHSYAHIGRMGTPRAHMWPVSTGHHPAMTFKVADGGNIDNSGILALLQRGSRKIVFFCTSYRLVDRNFDFSTASADDDSLIRAGVVDQLLDKFGYGENRADYSRNLTDSGNLLSHNQVFERSEILPIVRDLFDHIQAGTPPVLQFKANVLRNSWWGIQGGFEVEVLVVYLERSANFENALPEETREELAKGTGGAFGAYPAFETAMGGGTAAEYNLLAATSEYFVMQNRQLFEDFLR